MILLDGNREIENKNECLKFYSLQTISLFVALIKNYSYWKIALSKLQKRLIQNFEKMKKIRKKGKNQK